MSSHFEGKGIEGEISETLKHLRFGITGGDRSDRKALADLEVKGASLGSGDAALDHDLLVWFGDFHSSIAGGIEPAALRQAVSGLGSVVRDDGKAEVDLEEADAVANWQRLVHADTLTPVRRTKKTTNKRLKMAKNGCLEPLAHTRIAFSFVLPRQAWDKERSGRFQEGKGAAIKAAIKGRALSAFEPGLVALFCRRCVQPARRTVWRTAFWKGRCSSLRCEKRHLVLSFPYVCPEPVLAKCSFLYINGSTMPFFADVPFRGERAGGWAVQPH
jgi:hypothetical protein